MSEAGQSTQPVWLRILRSPLVRLIVLGPALFFMMMKNNEFMSIFKDRPLITIGITVCMALAALAVDEGPRHDPVRTAMAARAAAITG